MIISQKYGLPRTGVIKKDLNLRLRSVDKRLKTMDISRFTFIFAIYGKILVRFVNHFKESYLTRFSGLMHILSKFDIKVQFEIDLPENDQKTMADILK